MHITNENFEAAIERLRRDCCQACTGDVAEAAGVSPSAVCHFVAGRTRCPRVRTFLRLAAHFGYTVAASVVFRVADGEAA